jgi:hypothetical protein
MFGCYKRLAYLKAGQFTSAEFALSATGHSFEIMWVFRHKIPEHEI